MSPAKRIAMSEVIVLLALLVDVETSLAMELAAAVAERLASIADGGEPEPLPESEIEEWTRLAREVLDPPRRGLRLVN